MKSLEDQIQKITIKSEEVNRNCSDLFMVIKNQAINETKLSSGRRMILLDENKANRLMQLLERPVQNNQPNPTNERQPNEEIDDDDLVMED